MPHAVGENVYATSNEAGAIYIVADFVFDNHDFDTEGIYADNITADQLASLTQYSTLVSSIKTDGHREERLETTSFLPGPYIILAVDRAGNVSEPIGIPFVYIII